MQEGHHFCKSVCLVSDPCNKSKAIFIYQTEAASWLLSERRQNLCFADDYSDKNCFKCLILAGCWYTFTHVTQRLQENLLHPGVSAARARPLPPPGAFVFDVVASLMWRCAHTPCKEKTACAGLAFYTAVWLCWPLPMHKTSVLIVSGGIFCCLKTGFSLDQRVFWLLMHTAVKKITGKTVEVIVAILHWIKTLLPYLRKSPTFYFWTFKFVLQTG